MLVRPRDKRPARKVPLWTPRLDEDVTGAERLRQRHAEMRRSGHDA
jgi:hypothetical protein